MSAPGRDHRRRAWSRRSVPPTRIASPCPISRTVTCSRPSGRDASVMASSAAPRPRRWPWTEQPADQAGGRVAALRQVAVEGGGGAKRPGRQAEDRSQAAASGAGTVTSSAAFGRDATAVPSVTMIRRTSHAEPPANQARPSATASTGIAPPSSPTTDATAHRSIAARHRRHDEDIGERGDEREPFEVDEDDRQRRQLSRRGERDGLADPRRPRGQPSLDRRAEPKRPAVASRESWNPTSHSTGGATRSMEQRRLAPCRCGMRVREPPSRATSMRHRHGRDRRARPGEEDVADGRGGHAPVRRPPGRRSSGRAAAATSAATIAMFQPEIAR